MIDKIINTLEKEIHLAEYVCSDYCDGVEISIIKNAIDIMKSQKAEIEMLKAKNTYVSLIDGHIEAEKDGAE